MRLPDTLYDAAQVSALERLAIEAHGIPADVLMDRAGISALTLLRSVWPRAHKPVVVCGPGNNGGDGYLLARRALEAGLEPCVLSVGPPPRSGPAAGARAKCEAAGIRVQPFDASILALGDVVVDAIFGIGLVREVQGAMRAAVEAINAARRPVLAIDIPSGVNADSGAVMGAAVRADATITFIGLKAGAYTGGGREHVGEIYFDDLDVPKEIYAAVTPLARRLTETPLASMVKRRRRDAHKGTFGHVLAIGGDQGMAGAVRLAGEAAYRSGAGLVTIATHPTHAAQLSAARPELLAYGVVDGLELRPLLARASVIAVGPGLGLGAFGQALFTTALDSCLPMVVDADALNLLALDPTERRDWILTPHPGEAARLLETTTAAVQSDRFDAVRALQKRYGGVVVLKGSGTLIAASEHEPIWLCDRGNPGMASGGMGDVLTGVIAALVGQGYALADAAQLGVWVHAAAGDDAAAAGETGLLASDLFPLLRTRLQRLASHAVRS